MIYGMDDPDRMCGNCEYYRPDINPETGRIRPSRPGACGYSIEWPKIPSAFHISHHRDSIWPGSCRQCLTFKAKAKLMRTQGPELDML